MGVFAVIVLHVAASKWYSTDVHSFDWQVINFYHGAATRWAVPVFVMISGTLFLGREVSLMRIYSKNIVRIIAAFAFWSLIYSVAKYFEIGTVKGALKHFLQGHYHLWFLFMITGLYMIVPFMKKISESEFLTKYFLVLSLIFAFVLPQSIEIFSCFTNLSGKLFRNILSNTHMHFVMGYSGYFLLGYFLNEIYISPKLTRFIYAAGIISFIVMIFISKANSNFYMPLSINALLEATAIFVLFKNNFNRQSKFIKRLSQYSFGAYLAHPALIFIVKKLGLTPLTFNPVISVPIIAALVFVMSFAVSRALHYIPVLNKYIV